MCAPSLGSWSWSSSRSFGSFYSVLLLFDVAVVVEVMWWSSSSFLGLLLDMWAVVRPLGSFE